MTIDSRGDSPERVRREQASRMNPLNQGGVGGLLALVLAFVAFSKGDEMNPEEAHKLAVMLGFSSLEEMNQWRNAANGSIDLAFRSVPWHNADYEKISRNYSNYHKYGADLPLETGNADFDHAVKFILKIEGKWNPNEPRGAVAMYGINSEANPDIDVRNLTVSGAIRTYKERYWDTVKGIDDLPQGLALAAFDLSVNSGPGRANEFLKKCDGDINKFMQLRADYYERLCQKPEFAQYRDGWFNRLGKVSNEIQKLAQTERQQAFAKAQTNADVDRTGRSSDEENPAKKQGRPAEFDTAAAGANAEPQNQQPPPPTTQAPEVVQDNRLG